MIILPLLAALSAIGNCESATTTCTLPTRAANDLIITCAYKSSLTAPSAPTGYTAITGTSASASVSSQNCACRIATNNASDNVTWTSTVGMAVVIYRGQQSTATCTNNIGGVATGTGASTTLTYPAITMSVVDGTSWLVGFAGQTTATNLSTNGTPAGVTQRNTSGAIATAVAWDTNAGVSSDGSKTATITSANRWRAVQLEVIAAVAIPSPSNPPSQLVQHLASSSNENNTPFPGNNYKFTLPDPVLAGNLLIMGVTFGANPFSSLTTVSTITDSSGDTWSTTPTVNTTDGGATRTNVFVLPNASAGVHTITVGLSASVGTFQYTVSEFSGLATASPANGTAGQAAVPAHSTIGTGSFTPGNNNASGGNLIWTYCADDATPSGSGGFTSIDTSLAGFGLLDASIGTNSAELFHASEAWVQATSAAINPGFITSGNTTDTWTCVAVALKISAGAGTTHGSGIYIKSIIHETNSAPPATWNMKLPCQGNVLVIRTNDDPNLTSITDTNSNTWTRVAGQVGSPDPQIWSTGGSPTCSNDMKVTLHYSSVPGNRTVLFYDIANANASPIGNNTSSTPGTGSVTNSPFTINDHPDFTPSLANGLVIVAVGFGVGPTDTMGAGAPAGAIQDFVYYTGEVDSDRMDSGDGAAHYFNGASTAAETWNWHLPNPDADPADGTGDSSATSVGGTAILIKGPVVAGGSATPPMLPLLGVGP